MIEIKKDKKRVFLETYGCQMNEYDTELVKSILAKENYSFTKNEHEADIIMLNTCAVRENAHRKVYGRVHEILHRRREENKLQGAPVLNAPAPQGHRATGELATPRKPIIGILGCMATNLRQELFENRNLKIDFIAGPDSYKRLPDLIREAQGGEKSFDLTLSEFETYSDVYPARKEGINAWIAIMRGCNNFCTFCVVPYTRGRERSRSVENIVEEVRRLADDGFKQVTLLGQNVNSYRHEEQDFAYLLEEVAKINGIERVRFTSPHPKDFPDRVIDAIASNPKLCKQLHVPMQSGNDRVLDVMNRTYTQKEYLDLIEKMRKKIPGVALSTDVIVGFPTETDAEFEDTYNVMKTVEFDSAFIFKYSERKNTIAAKKFPDDIPEAVKTERIVRLNELQKAHSLKRNRAHIGSVEKVLVEAEATAKSEKHQRDEIQARADNNKIVIIPAGTAKLGDFLNVRITDATTYVLKGELI
ncbi:MAG: tRNA (N6-isopentenyl adenosine(37)-C2)-methylthiotransferase MiaB [Candidatus Omnitrophica bacterium]|nr:tRNA (N6-isopentenyl adenosine(37)-C2)-methylthiotransferase MiaB [Candidatus Omnitrophota bacterium]